jgi:hypothetical protein
VRISTFVGVDIDVDRWTELTDVTGTKAIRRHVREEIVAIVHERLGDMGVLEKDQVDAVGTRGTPKTHQGEQK